MGIKSLLYILTVPFVIWAIDGVNINTIFKKNKLMQATVFYIMIIIATSYLIVNFFYDFFTYSRFIF